MLTLIFGIRASEPPRAWRTTEKARPDRVKTPRSCGKWAFFFVAIEQINIRCTFISTASCDEQHGLYRIILAYVSDDLEAFL